MNYTNPHNIKVECLDGFNFSIATGAHAYCSPREDEPEAYSEIELGYPSSNDVLIYLFAEETGKPTDTVYPYVPVNIVKQLIKKHGGLVPSPKYKNNKNLKWATTPSKPRFPFIDIKKKSIESDLHEYLCEFPIIEKEDKHYLDMEAPHNYAALFESVTPLDDLPGLGKWNLPDFINENDEQVNIDVGLTLTFLECHLMEGSGYPAKYATKLEIEIDPLSH